MYTCMYVGSWLMWVEWVMYGYKCMYAVQLTSNELWAQCHSIVKLLAHRQHAQIVVRAWKLALLCHRIKQIFLVWLSILLL